MADHPVFENDVLLGSWPLPSFICGHGIFWALAVE